MKARAEKIRQAIELLSQLQPAAFDTRRAERIAQADKIATLLPRRLKGIPAPAKIRQLAELSGAGFKRARAEATAALESWLADFEAAGTPPETLAAIAAIAGDSAVALSRNAQEAWRAHAGGSFKAAAVMAGSVLEGLLQASLQRLGARAQAAYQQLHPRRKPPASAEHFSMDEAIAVLREAGVISSAGAHFARGLKDLRNQVHPAVERRQRFRLGVAQSELALCTLQALTAELALLRIDLP